MILRIIGFRTHFDDWQLKADYVEKVYTTLYQLIQNMYFR